MVNNYLEHLVKFVLHWAYLTNGSATDGSNVLFYYVQRYWFMLVHKCKSKNIREGYSVMSKVKCILS